jgi:hypothetical protein
MIWWAKHASSGCDPPDEYLRVDLLPLAQAVWGMGTDQLVADLRYGGDMAPKRKKPAETTGWNIFYYQ